MQPRHVQIAEALGWTDLRDDGEWTGLPPIHSVRPSRLEARERATVPRYDSDGNFGMWIIEKYHPKIRPYEDDRIWRFEVRARGIRVSGRSPMEAIGEWILKVRQSGIYLNP